MNWLYILTCLVFSFPAKALDVRPGWVREVRSDLRLLPGAKISAAALAPGLSPRRQAALLKPLAADLRASLKLKNYKRIDPKQRRLLINRSLARVEEKANERARQIIDGAENLSPEFAEDALRDSDSLIADQYPYLAKSLRQPLMAARTKLQKHFDEWDRRVVMAKAERTARGLAGSEPESDFYKAFMKKDAGEKKMVEVRAKFDPIMEKAQAYLMEDKQRPDRNLRLSSWKALEVSLERVAEDPNFIPEDQREMYLAVVWFEVQHYRDYVMKDKRLKTGEKKARMADTSEFLRLLSDFLN